MRNIPLALGSFIVGACCAFIVSSGIHTSTSAQAAIGAPPDAVPKVVPLNTTNVVKFDVFKGSAQQLDGLNCEDCLFKDAQIRYGGGAYRLKNSKAVGTVTIVLSGAALNTWVFLHQIGAFPPPPKPIGPPPLYEMPHKFTASAEPTIKAKATSTTPITLISAVGGE